MIFYVKVKKKKYKCKLKKIFFVHFCQKSQIKLKWFNIVWGVKTFYRHCIGDSYSDPDLVLLGNGLKPDLVFFSVYAVMVSALPL